MRVKSWIATKAPIPMYNPLHPSEIVRHECLEPLGLTITRAAKHRPKIARIHRHPTVIRDSILPSFPRKRESSGERAA